MKSTKRADTIAIYFENLHLHLISGIIHFTLCLCMTKSKSKYLESEELSYDIFYVQLEK